jgi:hypothetical protein
MGTNFDDFLRQANRLIKTNGTLLIAEVSARFIDVEKFIANLTKHLGFKFLKKKLVGDYKINIQENPTAFYVLEFQKVCEANLNTNAYFCKLLKPCTYKQRHINQISSKQKKKRNKKFSCWK